MRGKFITTTLKLAVLSGSKSKSFQVKETNADLSSYRIIWSKKKVENMPLATKMNVAEIKMAAAL